MKRLKVAHIITRLELGGAQQNTLYCCAHHDRRFFEVILLCGKGGYLDAEAAKIRDCKVYFLDELKHPIRPWWDFLAYSRVVSILREEKVDLVHTHSSKAGLLGRWAAKRAGTPRILHTVHGWGFFPGQFFLKRLFFQLLERATAPFTDLLVAVSAQNKKEGLAAGIGKDSQYRIIHSGIEPAPLALPAALAGRLKKKWALGSRPVVLVLSNFKKQKSPLDVVKTAKILEALCPEVLFLWAGDGPLRGEVEAQIQSEGLQKKFKLLGWREDVGELLAVSDVLLLTSLHEGLPRVVLQAMAAGKPVVATAVNGTPEAVEAGVTGCLRTPGDTRGLAEDLNRILSDKGLGKKMGLAGKRALKGTFRINEMLREIEKLYRSL